MDSKNSICVAYFDSFIWVQIDGCANSQNTPGIKNVLYNYLDKGIFKFVIDFNLCRGIDSTFIGMLYRLGILSSQKSKAGGVEIINSNERNEKSIRKLGLDFGIKIYDNYESWGKYKSEVNEKLIAVDSKKFNERQRMCLSLEFHESLMEANEENRKQFSDVVDFLKKDLGENNH